MIIENKEMGIRFEVDNQQDFDKWYAIRKEQIRADAIDEFVREYGHIYTFGCVECKHLDDKVHCWECVGERLKEKK